MEALRKGEPVIIEEQGQLRKVSQLSDIWRMGLKMHFGKKAKQAQRDRRH